MRVTRLHLHPVKGCRRIEVDRAVVSPYGLAGDREWQVIPDGAHGMITQRQHPVLARVRVVLADGGIVLRADGARDLEVARPAAVSVTASTFTGPVSAGDAGDEAATWFTSLLGTPARLVAIAPGYERRFGDIFATEVGFGDAAPILVVNDASHRFLASRAVEPFGIERWRPNVVVDAGEPWVEDTWRTLRIGDATVQCVMPWPRCAVPQIDQDTGERHREPALVLRSHRWCEALPGTEPLLQTMLPGNALFGMASSAEPVGATVSVGDPVEVVGTGPALL